MKTYIAKKPFIHDQLGRIEKDQKFEATDAQVNPVKRFVEEYETKIHPQEPLLNKQQSASPAAPASQPQTAKRSGRGKRKTRTDGE